MPCVTLNHEFNAPAASVSTDGASVRTRLRSGSFRSLTLNELHRAVASKPATIGKTLHVPWSVRIRGASEPELDHAREGAEVGIAESIEPERERVSREVGHLGVVARVFREREQVAADDPDADVVEPADSQPLEQGAVEGVAHVDLLDLHPRAALDEVVDRVDAVVEHVVVREWLALDRWLAALVVDPVAVLEEWVLPRAVVDVAALDPVHEPVDGETLEPEPGGEAQVEVGVGVADLDKGLSVLVHVEDGLLARSAPIAAAYDVPLFVHDHAVAAPRLPRAGERGLVRVVVQLVDAPHGPVAVDDAEVLPFLDEEDAGPRVPRPDRGELEREPGPPRARAVAADVQGQIEVGRVS